MYEYFPDILIVMIKFMTRYMKRDDETLAVEDYNFILVGLHITRYV